MCPLCRIFAPCILTLTDPPLLQGWEADMDDDVREQVAKHGAVAEVLTSPSSASGEVFVRMADVLGGIAAATALAGRVFGGRGA